MSIRASCLNIVAIGFLFLIPCSVVGQSIDWQLQGNAPWSRGIPKRSMHLRARCGSLAVGNPRSRHPLGMFGRVRMGGIGNASHRKHLGYIAIYPCPVFFASECGCWEVGTTGGCQGIRQVIRFGRLKMDCCGNKSTVVPLGPLDSLESRLLTAIDSGY